MSNEAVLYGMLVEHLRDLWVEQSAQFNESSLAEEKARIDALIRAWFFTPQNDDLSGFTPQQIIRNEEQHRPNRVPHTHADGAFHADCPLCQLLDDSPPDMDHDWHFGLAPEKSLLDEYDPEGYNARWDDPPPSSEEKPELDPDSETTNAPAKEARTWLEQNPSPNCFAGNRFYDKQEALDFVQRLYELGALVILVDNLLDEPYRLREQGGPYADTLHVYLPPDANARADIRAIFEYELAERQGLDLRPYDAGELLIFWWD